MKTFEDIGVPEGMAVEFAKKNIFTPDQLARLKPRIYHDYREFKLIQECIPGRYAAVKGKIKYVEKRFGKRWFLKFTFEQTDGNTFIFFTFGNTGMLKDYISITGQPVVVCGRVSFSQYGYSFDRVDRIYLEEYFPPKIASEYPVFGRAGSNAVKESDVRKAVMASISVQKEYLPEGLLEKTGQVSYPDAVRLLHYPSVPADVRKAYARLRFDEMLYFYLGMRKLFEGTLETEVRLKDISLMERFISSLPEMTGKAAFRLTNDQMKVIGAVRDVCMSGRRLDCLVQGDVGCGKTMVAAAAMFLAAGSGFQAVLMAPIGELARQHYEEIRSYAEYLGVEAVFLSGELKVKERRTALEEIRTGRCRIIIGTQSVLSDDVAFHSLGLVVTDEEHLFGVDQKEALGRKTKEGVHMLSMSATPIPRSLAQLIYGEGKQMFEIKEKPAGRKDIMTFIQTQRMNTLRFMYQEIQKGHQCYVVCPAVNKNEDFGIISIEDVERDYRHYFETFDSEVRIGVAHGKMKREEMADVLRKFKAGEIDVLIATTVIQVGINVPNATVIVIEQADRFGGSSLHQLRGRVGRSDLQSYCILITGQPKCRRLQVVRETNDGMKIAKADLEERKSGDLLGTAQSGENTFIEEIMQYPEEYRRVREFADSYLITDIIRKIPGMTSGLTPEEEARRKKKRPAAAKVPAAGKKSRKNSKNNKG